jgi:hypothetical protein
MKKKDYVSESYEKVIQANREDEILKAAREYFLERKLTNLTKYSSLDENICELLFTKYGNRGLDEITLCCNIGISENDGNFEVYL